MNEIFEFSFSLHQILTGLLSLFFLYFAWKDQRARTFDDFQSVKLTMLLPALAVLMVALFFYFFNYWSTEGVFLAIEFSLLIIMSVFDTKFAVAFFIFEMISRPWEIYPNDMMLSIPRDIFFLVIFSFLLHKIVRKKYYFQWNQASLFLFLFSVWMFFSVVTSSHVSIGLRSYFDVFTKGILIYFLIVNVVDKKEYIYPIQIAMIIGILEKACVSFYKTIFLSDMAEGGRLTSVGILQNSNDIAAILILGIPLTVYFFKNKNNRWMIVFVSIIISMFYGFLIWKAKSRGAVIGYAALLGSYYWIKAANKRRAAILLFIFAGLVFGAIKAIKRDASDLEGSTNNRIIYWKSGINMAVHHPLFGVGFDGFNRYFYEYALGDIGSEGKNRTIHSNWLLPLAEGGFPAFIFYILFWIAGLRTAYHLRQEHPEYFLAIVGYGTTITFLSHTYLLYPYILLGLVEATGTFYIDDKSVVQGQES